MLSVPPDDVAAVVELASQFSVEAPLVGETDAETISVRLNDAELLTAPVSKMYERWDTALERMLERQ